MQIEHFFYWFLDPEWWISATQSTVGALIGFIGLYLVFLATRNHEKNLQKEIGKAEQSRIENDRTLTRVGDIIQACLNVEPSRMDRELTYFDNLIRLLVIFYAHEMRHRPQMARWALDQSIELSKRIRSGNLQVCLNYSMAMVGDFTKWLETGPTDDVKDRFNKNQILATWKKIEEETNSSLSVTWDELRSTDPEVEKRVKQRLDSWWR